VVQFWTGLRPVDDFTTTPTHLAWQQINRLLRAAGTKLDAEFAERDPARWHQAVQHTADLLAVLARTEHRPARLHRAHDQLSAPPSSRAADNHRRVDPGPR
jgi:hypothetical protein